MSAAGQARAIGLAVGDTIEGIEAGMGWWNTARLTLLWIGQDVAVWRVTSKTSSRPKWSVPSESAEWDLSCREWRIVDGGAA